jgi:hypothetical protein
MTFRQTPGLEKDCLLNTRVLNLIKCYNSLYKLSFKLRQEHRLRVLETKVLRAISGSKRVQMTEEWQRLHN